MKQLNQFLGTGDQQRNPTVNVIQGQRIVFPRNPVTGILQFQYQQLIRAEDRSVSCWDIAIAPVYRQGTGPDDQGMPVPPASDGGPTLRMTWGGGGVSWRQELFPGGASRGVCFTVAGDNVMLEARPTDVTTVFDDQTNPVLQAWVKPSVSPQPRSFLYQTFSVGPGPVPVTLAVPGFARNVIVSKTPATATFTLTWNGVTGTIVQAFPGIQQFMTSVPVPQFAQEVVITPSVAGFVVLQWELIFS